MSEFDFTDPQTMELRKHLQESFPQLCEHTYEVMLITAAWGAGHGIRPIVIYGLHHLIAGMAVGAALDDPEANDHDSDHDGNHEAGHA